MKTAILVALLLHAVVWRSVYAEGDATRGEQLYESRCIACHALDANRVGPQHRGVYGRKAGSVADFTYSPALAAAQVIWSETTLNRWLTDPEALVPGQRMNFRVPSADDRADLIAFLRRESGK
jgi:cytochrome c